MKLYFENPYGERKLIGTYSKDSEIPDAINKYVKKINPNFKIYYYRFYENDNKEIVYDVGSWSEFFILVKEIEPKGE